MRTLDQVMGPSVGYVPGLHSAAYFPQSVVSPWDWRDSFPNVETLISSLRETLVVGTRDFLQSLEQPLTEPALVCLGLPFTALDPVIMRDAIILANEQLNPAYKLSLAARDVTFRVLQAKFKGPIPPAMVIIVTSIAEP